MVRLDTYYTESSYIGWDKPAAAVVVIVFHTSAASKVTHVLVPEAQLHLIGIFTTENYALYRIIRTERFEFKKRLSGLNSEVS